MDIDTFEALSPSRFFCAHKNPLILKSQIYIFDCQMELPRFLHLLTKTPLYVAVLTFSFSFNIIIPIQLIFRNNPCLI